MSNIKSEIVEKKVEPINGFAALVVAVLLFIGGLIVGFTVSIFLGILMVLGAFILSMGICIINPNEAVVLQWFGSYYGTVYKNGLFFVNPLTSGHKVSLKRQNFSSEKVRTNDRRGNPIDLGVTVAWKVKNSTFSFYNVEGDLNSFIKAQVLGIFSEEAPKYYFDVNDNDEAHKNELVFRRNGGQIAEKLKLVLGKRVESVGIEILDLSFSHCSYAKEIAHSMLQKQQAEALLDARKTIVEGASKLVEELIENFSKSKKIKMSDEDVAILARNLMIVLVSEKEVTPTINLD